MGQARLSSSTGPLSSDSLTVVARRRDSLFFHAVSHLDGIALKFREFSHCRVVIAIKVVELKRQRGIICFERSKHFGIDLNGLFDSRLISLGSTTRACKGGVPDRIQ